MKANIGDYCSWIGPYQISKWFQSLPILDRDREKFGDWLSETWVSDLCSWIHSKQKRKIKIKLDHWDSWNADETMAILILPILKQLRLNKHGAPHVADEDVPEELRSTNAPPKENEWDTDENHFKRFDWVLDEIIWAFEQLQPDCDWEDQFHSGNMDHVWEKCENSNLSELKHGPKHTHKFDAEGYKAYSSKIDNGLRLFGVHYRGLWS